MKNKNWDDFKVHCSSIYDLMTRPKGSEPLTTKQVTDLEKLVAKTTLTGPQADNYCDLLAKKQRSKDPELSQGAISHLIKRYSWDKYNNRIASIDFGFNPAVKGTQLEDAAINMLATFDRANYKKHGEMVSNDYMLGKCDVLCGTRNKIIDVKTSWNINTFLPILNKKLDIKYWYQMQGYLELHNINYGEVCFVLLNTPTQLVEKVREKLREKYYFGEISREKFDEEMEKITLSFNYDKIPPHRRIIRFVVKRHPEVLPQIYRKVDLSRIWLNEFEVKHVQNKKIITLPDNYVQATEDSPEFDTADLCESH